MIYNTVMGKFHKKYKPSTAGTIAIGVLAVILVGTFLLSLPISSRERVWTDFLTSLFTATSATCVTGLTVVDTYSYFSMFGQSVILVLIQIGGLGFITFVSLFTLYIKKATSLTERKMAMQSAGGLRFDEIKKQLKYIFIGTFTFELIGSILLSAAFIPDMGWALGVRNGIFTAVSAFCNAGFTITDCVGQISLTSYASNWLVSLTVCVLVLVGGIGFFVWNDVKKYKFRFKRYSLHSKTVLFTTVLLTVAGWILFAVFEWNNAATIGDLSTGGKIIASLFLSVTPRTAGFANINYANLTNASSVLTVVYMFIGGSPGSTAGGLKTTTISVLIIAALATSRRKEETVAFHRRFDGEAVFQASAVLFLYIAASVVGILCLCAAETDAPLLSIVFEVISALGTVGLSVNFTATLSPFSLVVLTCLMFFGRVGGYSFVLIFSAERGAVKISHPKENILIG